MALFGLFGSNKDTEARARARRVSSHHRAAIRLDRQVNAQIDANRNAEKTGRRGRDWW